MLLASLAGWIGMVCAPAGDRSCCHGGSASLTTLTARDAGTLAFDWATMLVAMMLPLMLAPVRHVRDRSLARRRARATALFLSSYFAVWMVAGAVLIPASLALRSSGASTTLLIAGAFAIAAAWQFSPLKQACLNRLHAHAELPAFGGAADVGVIRFGVSHGVFCVGSCWALMALPMFGSSAPAASMLAVSLWVWGEALGGPAAATWSLRFPARALRLVFARAGALAASFGTTRRAQA
jgi:predicted metal-binding membrane protein